MKYPEYTSNCATVIVERSDGRKCKAIFYWNGTTATFACYGADITESVVAWQYDHPTEKGGEADA